VVTTRAVAGAPVLVAALAVLAAPSCFDVQTVDPGPLVVDDFEDGDYLPALPGFDRWFCYSFNPEGSQGYHCAGAAGDESTSALYLDAQIDDPPDGKQQHGGAALATKSRVPLEINPYREFVFSAKLESSTPALPSDAYMYVELGCSTALATDGSRPGDLYVVAGVDYKSSWQTYRFGVTSFGPPPWVLTHVMGGPERCRALVDSIRFTIDAQIVDGESGRGILTIDNIHFE
jgi:hypothetical protein